MKISWNQRGNIYQKIEGDFSNVPTVPSGVYNLGLSMAGWYLERYADQFVFDYKIYGLQTDFMQYVLKTYTETSGNLGILLNGTKGGGKTVTAKLLANKLQLPIIIVKDMGDSNQSMIEYLSGFNFDCVLFFDEFEKNFKESDSTILQIMDGVYNIGYRKVFLLTTNELRVNDNLLSRPSRIRYVKEFKNLPLSAVNEYIDDNLKDKSCRQEVLDYVDTLTVSTIDILKSIVNEINIHGIDEFKKAKGFFNVAVSSYHYQVVRGYCERDQMKRFKDEKKNAMAVFAKQAYRYMNPIPYPRPKDQDNITEEEQKKLDEYFAETRKDFNINRETITTDSKFKSFKVGDIFDGDPIVQIDLKKNLIVTVDQEEDDYYFYHILNPDARPSLYGQSDYAYYGSYFC